MGDAPMQDGSGNGVPLCTTGDIPSNGMKMCVANGKEYLVVQQDGAFHVYQHHCPHRGGPLSKGKLQDGVIRCPWHGSTFDARTGKLIKGPNVGPNIPIVRKGIALFVRNLHEYPMEIRQETIYLLQP